MTAGGIRRTCRCRDENRKLFGVGCPKLAQRGHGTWEIRQELAATVEGGRRFFRRKGYPTKNAAQDALDQVRELLNLAEHDEDREAVAALLDGLGRRDPLPTSEEVRRKLRAGLDLRGTGPLGEWLDQWLPTMKHLRRSSYVRYEADIRNHITPHIGHVRRDRVTVGHVRELFNKIEDTNDRITATNEDRDALTQQIRDTTKRAEKRALRAKLADLPPYRRVTGPSSQQRVLACLRKALNDLIAEQGATFNAAQHVTISAKRPKPIIWTTQRVDEWRTTGQRPGSVMVWTSAQAGVFLDYVAEHAPELEALWHIAVFRGPRRGELCGLGWTETDLHARTIEITTQITEVEFNVLGEDAPKSGAGERTIPLDDEGTQLLTAHQQRQEQRRLELGGAWIDTGKVFTREDGSLIRPSWLGDEFKRLYTAAGLPPIRFHDLRHTAATLMLAAGIDMKVVQETLGHSARAVTSDIYTSVLPELARAAAEAVVTIVPRTTTRGTHRAPTTTPGQPPGNHAPTTDQQARFAPRPQHPGNDETAAHVG